MRPTAALTFASVVAAAACHAAPQRILSVHDVVANIDRLNGQTVRVGGFLPGCGGYNCQLFADEAEAQRARAWFHFAAREHKKPAFDYPKEWLGVGSDGDIDRKAAPLVGHYVVITGRVDNQCRYHGEPGCTDREPDIHPQGIEAWQPPAGPAGGAMEKKV